jgi:phosphoglycolate phosphatase-like HAD superfamily hydrolase
MIQSPDAEPTRTNRAGHPDDCIPGVLRDADLVLWDFDGVIKDSLEAKSEGFRWIVRDADRSVCDRVQRHHESNGGVSRFEKIPLYLTWAGMPSDPATVRLACTEFSEYVVDAVANSPWVPGVQDYLRKNPHEQTFVLVTATPADEILRILDHLNLLPCFSQVLGAATPKADAISWSLAEHKCPAERAVFIGDSETDYRAAKHNCVPFLLRRHDLNKILATGLDVPSFRNLVCD